MHELTYLRRRDDQWRKGGRPDRINKALKAAQKPLTRHLWTPADAITFTPHVSENVYGDGRALFGIATINSRPAYWIIRGDSGWSSGYDCNAPDAATDIAEFIDQITMDIGYEFGDAEDEPYEWIGNRLRNTETGQFKSHASISYPVMNYGGGCHWFRIDWSEFDLKGLAMEKHPWARTDILARQ